MQLIKKAFWSLFFAIVLIIGGISIFKKNVQIEPYYLDLQKQQLKVSSAALTERCGQFEKDVLAHAQSMAIDSVLGQDIRSLSTALSLSANTSKKILAERNKNKVEALRTKIQDRFGSWKTEKGIDAISFIDTNGVVLWTDSPPLVKALGQSLLAQAEDVPVFASSTVDKEAKSNPLGQMLMENDFILKALSGKNPTLVMVHDQVLSFLGAAPILARNRIVGSVIVEQKQKEVSKFSPLPIFIYSRTKIQLGEAPSDFKIGLFADKKDAQLLKAHTPIAELPLLGKTEFQPWYTQSAGIGIWLQQFSIPHAPRVYAFVSSDNIEFYTQIATQQLTLTIYLSVLWLIFLGFLVFYRRGLMQGIDRISDFLGRIHRGIFTERQLVDRTFLKELHRLVYLVNANVEHVIEGSRIAPRSKHHDLPVIPGKDLHENIKDINELEFKGISDSGSLAVEDEQNDYENLESLADQLPDEDENTSKISTAEVLQGTESEDAVDNLDADKSLDLYEERKHTDKIEDLTTQTDSQPDTTFKEADLDSNTSEEPDEDNSISDIDKSDKADDQKKEMNDHKKIHRPESKLSRVFDDAVLEEVSDEEIKEIINTAPAYESHFKEIYNDFVALRKSCKEDTSDLNYEKFSNKLLNSRNAIINKHNCNDVRFKVYVKDGKAALKAMPAK